MAEAGNGAAGFGLLGEVSQWPLQRYGRFMLSAAEESPGPGPEAVTAPSPTWKVRSKGRNGRQMPISQGRAARLCLVTRGF
jgi:hypothetical protein